MRKRSPTSSGAAGRLDDPRSDPAQRPRRRARRFAELSVVDHEDVLARRAASRPLVKERGPEHAAVQEDVRRDEAVDVHLVVAPSAGLDVEEHRRKGDRYRRGGEHHLAEEIERVGMAARRDQPHVPDDELLGIEVHGAHVEPPAAIVRVGDLAQELGVDVPRDQRRERPGVGERIAAQERNQDRSDGEDVAVSRRRVELVQRGRRTAVRGKRTAPSARRSTRR